MTTRRQWLQWSAAALALTAVRVSIAGVPRAPKRLNLLFLGGTGFLGPHQVEYALARGHRVTLFNRGRSAAELYGDRVELLVGNRDRRLDQGLAALEGKRRWDAVIDNSGYLPRHVRDSAELLKDRTDRYLFVSTMSVYDRTSRSGTVDEQWPMVPLPDPDNEERAGRYGPLKAECDRIVRATYGERATVVRPTFVLGPGDDTDRFAYWLQRVADGGTVLGPRADAAPLQWVDARDLCPWIVTLVERNVGGAFNAAAPPMAWDDVLAAMRPLANGQVEIRRPPADVLRDLKLEQPLTRGDDPRVRLDGGLAVRHGLTYRPMVDTVRATWAWWQQQTPERRAEAVAGWPKPEQERAALEKLAAR
jgi:2'-hydroxyisoflavone reductase